MARRKDTAEAPAPEGFWDELKDYHRKLWEATEGTHRRGLLWLSKHAVDEWLRHDPEEAKLGIGTRWRGQQYIGGTLFGSLNISRMRVVDVGAAAGAINTDAPVENIYITYSVPNEGSRKPPELAVCRRALTPGDLIQPPPLAVARMEMPELHTGLEAPEAGDYTQVLNEMAIGASGNFRVPPELR